MDFNSRHIVRDMVAELANANGWLNSSPSGCYNPYSRKYPSEIKFWRFWQYTGNACYTIINPKLNPDYQDSQNIKSLGETGYHGDVNTLSTEGETSATVDSVNYLCEILKVAPAVLNQGAMMLVFIDGEKREVYYDHYDAQFNSTSPDEYGKIAKGWYTPSLDKMLKKHKWQAMQIICARRTCPTFSPPLEVTLPIEKHITVTMCHMNFEGVAYPISDDSTWEFMRLFK